MSHYARGVPLDALYPRRVVVTGIGLVTAPPHTLAFGLYHAIDFRLRAIPLLDAHMEAKYGDEWRSYASRTKRLVPFVL